MIVYIHGFNSSSRSQKANVLKEALIDNDYRGEFITPDLSHKPFEAVEELMFLIKDVDRSEVTLIGSSLGGFYATWLTEKMGVRSILINPALTPHIGLREYLGTQTNLHTGEVYKLTETHLIQWEQYYVERLQAIEAYFLMHTMGDELLDWRLARDRYKGARQLIIEGGDHGFSEFPDYVNNVLDFADIKIRAKKS